MTDSKTATEKAVAQLKAYAKHMYDNAEGIIGDIDKPNYVAEGGIRVSFTLLEDDVAPTLCVDMNYLVLDALEAI